MATPVFFLSYKRALLNGSAGDLDASGAVKVALIDDTLAPDAETHDNWSDLSANEVSGDGYTAGGEALDNASIDDDDDDVIFGHDNVVWGQEAGGFEDARHAVWYFASGGALIAAMDLGADRGNVAGSLTLGIGAGGVVRQQ